MQRRAPGPLFILVSLWARSSFTLAFMALASPCVRSLVWLAPSRSWGGDGDTGGGPIAGGLHTPSASEPLVLPVVDELARGVALTAWWSDPP
jgi:hypothetical protein